MTAADPTTLRCMRCGCALDPADDWAGWSVLVVGDRLNGQVVCPSCHTDEERAEIVITQATTRTELIDCGDVILALSIPKDGET